MTDLLIISGEAAGAAAAKAAKVAIAGTAIAEADSGNFGLLFWIPVIIIGLYFLLKK